MARRFLDQGGYSYKNVEAENNLELVEKYDIHRAPTLVIVGENGFEKLDNVSLIRSYTNKRA